MENATLIKTLKLNKLIPYYSIAKPFSTRLVFGNIVSEKFFLFSTIPESHRLGNVGVLKNKICGLCYQVCRFFVKKGNYNIHALKPLYLLPH